MGSTLWQSQSLDAPRISLEFVRLQVEKLRTDFRREYQVMLGSSLLVIMIVATSIYKSSSDSIANMLVRQLGGLLVVAGAVFLTYLVRRRHKASTIDEGEQITQSLEAYRVVLQQHRDHNLGVWPGVLWIMGPALFVVIGGGILYDQRPNKLLRYSVLIVLSFLAFAWTAWYSKRKGKQYQRELDALATMDSK